MSFILNLIKERVQNSIKVEVLPSKYNKYPVVVTDTSESITSGWSVTYLPQKSKFGSNLHEPKGRFSEITMTNAESLISDLSVVYSKFMQGEGVGKMYGTDAAMYQPNDKMWYTAMQRPKGVSITLTVTDELSPFHMLQANFFVIQNGDPNRHPIMGYDYCFSAESNTWTEKRDNASMTAKKKQVIAIHQEGQDGPKMAKVAGNVMPNGMVAIDEKNTKTEWVQEATNERKLVSALYETIILEIALEYASNNLPAESQYTGAFGNAANAGQNWSTSSVTPGFVNTDPQSQAPQTNQSQAPQANQNPSFGQNTANTFNASNQGNQGNAFGQQQPQQQVQQQPVPEMETAGPNW